jgi:glycosyltransferase involved in cell wall biosynthesis
VNAAGGLFILSNMREYGGAERSLAVLAPHLAAATPLRIFVENDRHHAELAALEHSRISLVPVAKGNAPGALLAVAATLRRCVRSEAPRAILANGHKGALLLALCRPFLPRGLRYGVYVRDFAFTTMPIITALLRDARFFAPSEVVFAHAPYRRAGLTRRAHEVIPNAVEPAGAASPEEDFIGCCARLVPWKGVDLLLRAFALVADEFPTVQLRLYGEPIDPGYAASLRQLAGSLQLVDRVEFRGFEDDREAVFGRGLFFVVPSTSRPPGPETFGRVVIEAWAHGKPVIAFRCGGPAQLIADGEDGCLVPEGDVAALAGRIRELLDDPAKRRALGACGQARTLVEFAPPAIAARLLHALLPP